MSRLPIKSARACSANVYSVKTAQGPRSRYAGRLFWTMARWWRKCSDKGRFLRFCCSFRTPTSYQWRALREQIYGSSCSFYSDLHLCQWNYSSKSVTYRDIEVGKATILLSLRRLLLPASMGLLRKRPSFNPWDYLRQLAAAYSAKAGLVWLMIATTSEVHSLRHTIRLSWQQLPHSSPTRRNACVVLHEHLNVSGLTMPKKLLHRSWDILRNRNPPRRDSRPIRFWIPKSYWSSESKTPADRLRLFPEWGAKQTRKKGLPDDGAIWRSTVVPRWSHSVLGRGEQNPEEWKRRPEKAAFKGICLPDLREIVQ